MSGVQRYHMRAEIDDREGVEIWPVKDDTGRLVMWEDHEAALAEAVGFGYDAGFQSGKFPGYDEGFNAALDAAIGTGLAVEDVNRIEALRKSTSQPEPPCECWLCHDTNLTCDKCENCMTLAAAAQPEGGDRG